MIEIPCFQIKRPSSAAQGLQRVGRGKDRRTTKEEEVVSMHVDTQSWEPSGLIELLKGLTRLSMNMCIPLIHMHLSPSADQLTTLFSIYAVCVFNY